MIVVESAGITDVGRKRQGNEDALFMDDASGLYVVADGMGGHRAGEVASGIVVKALSDSMATGPGERPIEEAVAQDDTLSAESKRLLSAIHAANRAVYQASLDNESYRGMGSTISAVYFAGETLTAANVGDSPIYLVHAGGLELLSVPHTVMAEHEAIDGDGSRGLAEEFRHILTRAIGVQETVQPDVCEVPLFEGDLLVISSDGLTDKVDPGEILEVVSKKPPDKACRFLVALANERGGDDNITVIVVKIKKVKRENDGIKRFVSRVKHGLKLLGLLEM